MTDKQKEQIAKYRQEGYGYTQISKMMDLSINSIKTYCRRHSLTGSEVEPVKPQQRGDACECCGASITQTPGRKKKRFCSDRCRMVWWNSHQDQVKRKANYQFTCCYCKKPFVAYGNANRKYCSHECYIEDRFGGIN